MPNHETLTTLRHLRTLTAEMEYEEAGKIKSVRDGISVVRAECRKILTTLKVVIKEVEQLRQECEQLKADVAKLKESSDIQQQKNNAN
jgi:hypothetical protein